LTQSAAVEISLGRVRGRVENEVCHYLGIPFAAPPVGERRFSAPEAPEPWTGILDAERYGAAPPQRSDELSVKLGLAGEHPMSEDCLYLNVFAPERASSEPRAIMVWLHGGAYISGTAAGPIYDGSRLAKAGDVIVVTLNYRVGALGFMAADAPNVGSQDQLAALRFVRDEIAAFGGDPTRITVFGESAGAGSLVALLAMPAARGVFQRAIVQSAAAEGFLSRAEAEERAELFAEAAGVTPGDLDALRTLDVEAILDAQAKCQEPGPRRIGMYFAPFVDGELLEQPPLDAIAAGSARDVSLIVGTTAQEMQLYHLSSLFPELPDALIPHAMAPRLAGSPERALEAANGLMQFYTAPEVEDSDRFFAVETDASLFVPSALLAERQAAHNEATFMYRFCWPSPMDGGRLGACHALDIAFALGTIDLVPEFAGEGAETQAVSRAMQAAWVSFAKTGSPACPGVSRFSDS